MDLRDPTITGGNGIRKVGHRPNEPVDHRRIVGIIGNLRHDAVFCVVLLLRPRRGEHDAHLLETGQGVWTGAVGDTDLGRSGPITLHRWHPSGHRHDGATAGEPRTEPGPGRHRDVFLVAQRRPDVHPSLAIAAVGDGPQPDHERLGVRAAELDSLGEVGHTRPYLSSLGYPHEPHQRSAAGTVVPRGGQPPR
jgi:hypothetical protein